MSLNWRNFIAQGENERILTDYLSFCVKLLNKVLGTGEMSAEIIGVGKSCVMISERAMWPEAITIMIWIVKTLSLAMVFLHVQLPTSPCSCITFFSTFCLEWEQKSCIIFLLSSDMINSITNVRRLCCSFSVLSRETWKSGMKNQKILLDWCKRA